MPVLQVAKVLAYVVGNEYVAVVTYGSRRLSSAKLGSLFFIFSWTYGSLVLLYSRATLPPHHHPPGPFQQRR